MAETAIWPDAIKNMCSASEPSQQKVLQFVIRHRACRAGSRKSDENINQKISGPCRRIEDVFRTMSKLDRPHKSAAESRPNMPGIWTITLVGFIIFDVWLVNLLVGLDENLLGGRGTFGDVFGMSNSLFSGLALAGLVYAVILQRSEISVAREELRRTKEIFEKQSASLELQNSESRKQIFEGTFFQLLRVFSDITENLDLTNQQRGVTRGKDVIAVFEKRLSTVDFELVAENKPRSHKIVYERLYAKNQNDLGHYFRTLYTTLKFVDTSSSSNKKFYTNILRAQLSNPELHLILYNGLSENGVDKLKPLLEKYAFFDNLPLSRVQYRDALREYEPEAFGDNKQILKHLEASSDT
jgi:hypothetical protein